ncbi:hypothetical protein KR222_005831 [Zaprionus bogoriensis]|nr:hypothetical protein KR222_005831 [Zaprionus bogoriensis]
MFGKPRIALTSLLGIVLATLGLIYVTNVERIQQSILHWLMVLAPNSMMTNMWQFPTVGMTASIYIFNWTNAEEFDNPDVKPRFQELGPYTFHEKQKKLNLTWHEENSTVSYLRQSRFYFDAAASGGKLTDVVVTPNTVSVGILHKAQSWSPMLRSLVHMAIKLYNNDATFVRTVDDWLFTGFESPLIKISKMIPTSMIPEIYFPFERVGYGYPRNSSTDIYGHHNVYTGKQDFSKLGQIARWRYTNVSIQSSHCKLRGSTGEFHPIPLQKGKPITYFLPDICRELQVDYSETTIFEGIEAYVYRGSKRNMANGTENPDNKCFCLENCEDVPSGVMNISSCWFDVPIFASYPHFYNADPSYVEGIEGIKPDKDKHEMVIILEPKTGMLLDIKGTLMISFLVEPRPGSIFRNARRNFLPLAWVDYKLRISPELLLYLKMVPISGIVAKVLGVLTVILGIALVLYYPRKMLMQKYFIRTIGITNLESKMQATSFCPERVKSQKAEGSPLLVGPPFLDTDKLAKEANC